MPGVGAGLEGACLPVRLTADAVQIEAEEGRLNVLAELMRGIVAAEGDERAEMVADGAMPAAVIPGPGDDEVRMVGVGLICVLEDLPWPPGVFLIPEACDVKVRDG